MGSPGNGCSADRYFGARLHSLWRAFTARIVGRQLPTDPMAARDWRGIPNLRQDVLTPLTNGRSAGRAEHTDLMPKTRWPSSVPTAATDDLL